MGAPLTPPGSSPPGDVSQPAGVTEALEQSLTGNREVHFRTRSVEPPAALYVTADDGLYVVISNVAAALNVAMTATLLLPDGRVQANSWGMTPPSTGLQTPYLFPLSEGFLLNVSIMPTSSIRHGTTWAFIALRRGGLASGINLQTLISDYLDSYGGPTWPGSPQSHSLSEPGLIVQSYYGNLATGLLPTVTVNSWNRILMRSIYAQLSCSAAVGTRQVLLDMLDPTGNIMFRDMTEITQAAGSSIGYSWGLKLGTSQTAAAANYMCRSLPEVYLIPSSSIVVNCANMQAGDQFIKVCVNYESWFSF
jgi:hypothetical protein